MLMLLLLLGLDIYSKVVIVIINENTPIVVGFATRNGRLAGTKTIAIA